MSEGGEPSFDWGALVPLVVHPMRVTIIEAMLRIDRPLSASDLKNLMDGEFGISFIAYHVKELAKIKAIKRVRKRRVRGATESFYFFATRS